MKTREQMNADAYWHVEYVWKQKFRAYFQGYAPDVLATAFERLAKQIRAGVV